MKHAYGSIYYGIFLKFLYYVFKNYEVFHMLFPAFLTDHKISNHKLWSWIIYDPHNCEFMGCINYISHTDHNILALLIFC